MRDFFLFLFAQDGINVLFGPVLALSVLLAVLLQRVQGRPVADLLPTDWTSVRTDVLLVLSGRLVLYGLQFVMPVLSIELVASQLGNAGGAQPGPVAWATFSLAHFLFADFSFWLVHWLRHKVPVLWAFHVVHHSAEYLNPITGYRRHPLEILWLNLSMTLLTAIPIVILVLLFPGVQPGGVLVVAVANLIFTLTIANLQHTQVWLSFPPLVENLLISPAMHQIHHSRDEAESQSNFGQILAVWDWGFGTQIRSADFDRESLRFGVDGVQHRTLYEMFLGPMVGAWHALVGRSEAGS